MRLPRACGMVAAWCPLIVLHYAAKAWVVRLPSFSPKPAVTKAVAVSAPAFLAQVKLSQELLPGIHEAKRSKNTGPAHGVGGFGGALPPAKAAAWYQYTGLLCLAWVAVVHLRALWGCASAGLSGPACGDQGDWDSHRDLRPKKLAVAEGNRGAPKPKENSCQSAVPSPCICTWYYIPRPLGPRDDGGHVPYESEKGLVWPSFGRIGAWAWVLAGVTKPQ